DASRPPLRRKTSAEQKKAYDKARSRTRVNIGSAFQRWRELKEREGLRSDVEVAVVALFLLDRSVTLVLLCFTELIYAGLMTSYPQPAGTADSTIIVAWVAYVCVGRSYQNRGETLLG
uniref:Uncharacterized protein n=1 Tax=Sinocyclocheilus anshuiensis TaxID=1608454 RepID=A0A671NA74_9TELE